MNALSVSIPSRSPEFPAEAESGFTVSVISGVLKQGGYILQDGQRAMKSASCIVEPEKGDKVLAFSSLEEGYAIAYIIQVLEFASGRENVDLKLHECKEVEWHQESLAIVASKKLSLLSLHSLELMSLKNAIEIKARQLITCITNSIVETARERITTAEFIQMKSSNLTQIQSKQAIITADDDIKIDGERINLG